jgi:hypothetical protein
MFVVTNMHNFNLNLTFPPTFTSIVRERAIAQTTAARVARIVGTDKRASGAMMEGHQDQVQQY